MAVSKTSLMDKLKSGSTLDKVSSPLNESKYFNNKEFITTSVPMVNLALSGKIDGGLPESGLTVFAGLSKTFKTQYALLCIQAFQKKYPEGITIFYDSEFGTPSSYFENYNIDTSKILHTPIMDIEQLKFDIINHMDKNISVDDKVLIVVDSIGNLSSKKELEDAKEEKSVLDMTRAKQLKSTFRMITPYLTLKRIPMVVINHTYSEIGLFAKDVMGGGTGIMYSANTVVFITKSQIKNSKGLQGYNFTLVLEKSRYVVEKSKFPIAVSFDKGISKYSGLLELAVEGGFVSKVGESYVRNHIEGDKKIPIQYQPNDVVSAWWKEIFKGTNFKEWLEQKYSYSGRQIISEDIEDVEDPETAEEDSANLNVDTQTGEFLEENAEENVEENIDEISEEVEESQE